ncbi:MAG: NTP transferase domain-containing protein [Nocardioides sp.]|nr:NTP transferase domain-containing protein [Nocardioides sp.]
MPATPAPSPSPGGVAAVVLAGGGGVRLGGLDKHAIEVDGQTLLEHALEVTDGSEDVVVVGPEVPTSRPVVFAREDPVGGGPAAGLLAGIEAVRQVRGALPDRVVALAVDMPLVTRRTVTRLLDALAEDTEADGVVLVDGEGRRQSLCAVYRVRPLLDSVPARWTSTYGLPMRRLLFGLHLVELPADPGEAHDIDTWEDLRDLEGFREPDE